MGGVTKAITGWIASHRKAVVAVAAGAVVVADAIIQGNPISWPAVIAAVLGALGVYAIPNTPPAPTVTPPAA